MCEDFSAALEADEVIWNIKRVQKAAGISLRSGEQNITRVICKEGQHC